jgi:hypothetical protein
MNKSEFPKGWDESGVHRVLAQYEGQSDDDAVEEDEAAVQPPETIMAIPHELVASVRELIAKHRQQ